jgi:hypothetical protein
VLSAHHQCSDIQSLGLANPDLSVCVLSCRVDIEHCAVMQSGVGLLALASFQLRPAASAMAWLSLPLPSSFLWSSRYQRHTWTCSLPTNIPAGHFELSLPQCHACNQQSVSFFPRMAVVILHWPFPLNWYGSQWWRCHTFAARQPHAMGYLSFSHACYPGVSWGVVSMGVLPYAGVAALLS